MEKLRKRLIEITYKYGLTHLSSTLSALPILFEIYNSKKEDEVFILSAGHSGLALYVILEHFYGIDAEKLYEKHGIHPNRDIENKIYCSTGSLGQGLTVAIGHALSDRSKNVYVYMTDGEMAEGCVWESLQYVHKIGLENLKIYVCINGISATEYIDVDYLVTRLNCFVPDKNILHLRIDKPINLGFSKDIALHYHRLTTEEYEKEMF